MLKKRGQLTIFFIFLFVIIIAVFFVVSLGKEEAKSSVGTGIKQELSVDDLNIRNFAESCAEKTGKEALFYLGFVGGNLKPDPFTYYSFDDEYKVPYFYIEGKNSIPVPYDENYWANLLDRYILNNFEACINDFESFEGANIEQGVVKSETEFTDSSVIFNVNFPATITRDFETVKLEPKYIKAVNARLRDILKTAAIIVEQEVKSDRYIHWDYLTEVSGKNYNITAFTEDNNTIIYRMIDLENKIDDEYYVFQWANKIGAQ